jgi:hypothetical protein
VQGDERVLNDFFRGADVSDQQRRQPDQGLVMHAVQRGYPMVGVQLGAVSDPSGVLT